MTTPSTSESNLAPLQPPNLYHLSPTYNKWCALRCADIVLLQDREVYFEGKRIHHYLNHPIRYIKLIGLIVAIDDFSRRRAYTIDDSSGACIECVALLPPPSKHSTSNPNSQAAPPPSKPTEPSIEHPQIPWENVEECKVVRILGVLSTYMTMPQIQIIKMGVVGNTEGERKWWDECRRLKREVLGREWRVSQEEVARWERRERRREERGREGGKKTKGKIKERKTERDTRDEVDKAQPDLLTREDEGKRKARPNPNPRYKDPQHLLDIATHPSTSTSIPNHHPHPHPKPTYEHPPKHRPRDSSPNKSTSKSQTTSPIKKRIIPVARPDLAKYNTFGL
ncbi:hypothetical protein DSL72_000301 [Monilinia vaccinii-corymbosi]|uniref:CST complex subunit Stn1 N-terminal domain-containing protein n=1 Tax=Monilinia vaccinii-corymbosi TaxID=61207 RepID=A0A8A3NYX6_9HELO|nr:hypothetical protein DSL72_000301 [Monilinia vaccinii-corymbosi]